MTITITPSTRAAMGLDEYLDFVSHDVDITDQDQVLASSEQLAALANNRTFMSDKLNDELRAWATFQSGNPYSSQTLALGAGNGFAVRANLWVPPSNARGASDWESDLFAYARPHDHNFSFLTVGYLGSGYATTIFEYDPGRIVGYPGERVELRFLERTRLERGKVMFYRASRDVHAQEHPEEFSVSINLMIMSPEVTTNSQYWFDLEKGTIRDHVQQNHSSSRMLLCDLARCFGDGATANVLESIASTHHVARVRSSAFEALCVLEQEHAEEVWRRALQDASPLVRHRARLALDLPDEA